MLIATRPAPLPRQDIVDEAALSATIAALDVPCERLASAMLKPLAQAEADGYLAVREAFAERHLDGLQAGRALASLRDTLIRQIFEVSATRVHPLPSPTAAERVAVIAVGGYGRGVLAPYSDLDLLFLTPYKRTPWTESVIETMLYTLWDLKLKVGHASRSVEDCLRLAGQDMTIRTSLLENRFICGDESLYEELRLRLRRDLFDGSAREFTAAKLAERDARHKRAGNSRYLLEPNIKEGKGGLRDLQSLFWIAKYLYDAEGAGDLVEQGVFTPGEARKFARCDAFLWSVRFWIHYIGGRAQEQLTFDRQIEIAEKLGYRAAHGRAPVERFMKRYFWVAKEVGDLTRIFCAGLEARHEVKAIGRGGVLGLLRRRQDPQAAALRMIGGRIALDGADQFEEDPKTILQLFVAAAKFGAPVHPDALKIIRRSRTLLDQLRDDPEAGALFLEALTSPGDPERALRLMNETGALGRFLPEFNRIVGQMQFDMYHHYTVDEHTIRAIGILSGIERGELIEDHPLASRLLKAGLDRRVLYTALLLHDIGKGRRENHSIVGERIALEVCPRLGMSASETELVAWLVRWHLLMSDFAQKRDITDRRTVEDFAHQVESMERLRLLLCITVCDIRAVGPNVWNGWKAQLLRQLYHEASAVLSGGHAALTETRKGRVLAAQAALRERLEGWPEEAVERFVGRHYPAYWLGLDTDTHEAHARMLAEAGDHDELMLRLDPDPGRDATKLSLSMPDHPGLFARMTGAIAVAKAGVVDARSFTTSDGMALNTFWIQDQDEEAYDEPDKLKHLRRVLERTLRGEIVPVRELRRRGIARRPEESFEVSPSVTFDNTASELYTVISVRGRDRVGLLYDLARAFERTSVNIASAVIATYGERAVDTFYVKDLFGHKIFNANKRAAIEAALLDALAPKD